MKEKKLNVMRVGPRLRKAILWECKEFPKDYGMEIDYQQAGERLVHLLIKSNIIPINVFKDLSEVWDNPELQNLKSNI